MKSFFMIIVLCSLFLSFKGVDVAAQGSSIGAIYNFGDSLSDTGNAVFLDANAGCSKPPYGQTTMAHPTGRCSDGLLIIDRFAQAFKLPLLSPYLNKSGDFTHGANFAVARATAVNTSQTSLLSQVDWFKTHLATTCANQADCKKKLQNALIVMGEIGGNDYNGPAFGGKANPLDLQSLTPKVIQFISDAIKGVIGLGATRIVVPGNFPLGCVTIFLEVYKTNDQTKYDQLGCLKNWNDLASYHNNQLQIMIKSLQQQYTDVKIVYADYFSAVQSVFQQGPSLGFDKDMHRACCGAGNNEFNYGGAYCGNPGSTACPNPNIRVSWDGIHLTQHAYQVMADKLLNEISSVLN